MRTYLIVLVCVLLVSSGASAEDEERPPPTCEIDLDALAFEAEGLDLLRSSVFFNPRTSRGFEIYAKEFPDHFAARLFIPFAWPVMHSTDAASFARELEKKRRSFAALAKSHQKIVFTISYMPDWLCRSADEKQLEGFWKVQNASSPKDEETWLELVRVYVRFCRQFEVERYYEFWNEPDLFYWQEDLESFLRLYEITAKVVRAEDPDAKVGGVAVNGWRGRARRSKDAPPITLALIERAAKQKLPLDFVSWHHFTYVDTQIDEAADAYRSAWKAAGLEGVPELLITEWSQPKGIRTRPYHAALMADTYLACLRARVDAQMQAAWEDFHAGEDGGYGLITQAGEKKPAYHVHKAIDRLVRGASGLAWLRSALGSVHEGHRSMFVARHADGRYVLAIWEVGLDVRAATAVTALIDGGVPADRLRFLPPDELETWFAGGETESGEHRAAIEAARKVFAGAPEPDDRRELVIAGAKQVKVSAASSIRESHAPKQVEVEGNRVRFRLRKYELLLLEIEVD